MVSHLEMLGWKLGETLIQVQVYHMLVGIITGIRPRNARAIYALYHSVPQIRPHPRRRLILIPQSKYYLSHALGCLPLKCLQQTWTARLTMDMLVLWASFRLTLSDALHLVPTPHRQWLHARKGGRNRERNCCILRIRPPPPRVLYWG